jgi:glycerate kinase
MKKILVAPQAFKGSISALDAAKASAEGILRVLPNCNVVLCPVADGGDGTLETLVDISNGSIKTDSVTGPNGEAIEASWGAMGDGVSAVIEMARMSGLAIIPIEDRNPLTATTYGLGEIISIALDEGFRKFIIGIGGSGTNDAGAGMAQALGVKLLDIDGTDISFGGGPLVHLDSIDMSGIDPRIFESEFMIACDVSNPLIGAEGASTVYGPQKGATEKMVMELDNSLARFGEIVERTLNKKVTWIPGAGAAGGLGAGMIAFLNGQLKSGVDIVLDKVLLKDKLKGVDLVITGEGSIDFQTIYNKAPIGVAKMAYSMGIPTVGIAGMLGKNYQVVHKDDGIKAVTSITQGPVTLKESSEASYQLILESVEQLVRFVEVGIGMQKGKPIK